MGIPFPWVEIFSAISAPAGVSRMWDKGLWLHIGQVQVSRPFEGI